MNRISLADVELSVCDSGQGQPILLLHGFPTSHLLWREVMPALEAAGFRPIAPDLAGFGESDAPGGADVRMTNQARWMFALLDRLRLEERPVIAAHDIGTAVAQLMVARDPARIRGLILIDGVYGDNWAMEEVESIRAWNPAAASRLVKLLGRRVRAWSDSAASQEKLREMLAIGEGEGAALRIIRSAQSMDPRSTAEILEQLRRHHPPTFVLWGQNDRFLPVESVGKPLATLFGAELKILPGGHFLPLDCPQDVAAEILSFAKSLPPER